MKINGHTKIAGLIGNPIAHSLSYTLHNAALEALGIDARYLPFPSPDTSSLKNLVSMMRTSGFVGANVTIPHKENIIPLLDSIDRNAQRIGAVNTITKQLDGTLLGKNSDAEGFLLSLKNASIQYTNRNVFLIGAGGAARAVAMILAPHVASITIWNRTPAKAQKLLSELRKKGFPNNISLSFCGDPSAYPLPPKSILIQCTPLGKEDEMPPHPQLDKSHTVIDLLYQYTPLLQQSHALGAQIQDGSSMLIHQAAISFSWWFSVPPPIEIMYRSLHKQRKIV